MDGCFLAACPTPAWMLAHTPAAGQPGDTQQSVLNSSTASAVAAAATATAAAARAAAAAAAGGPSTSAPGPHAASLLSRPSHTPLDEATGGRVPNRLHGCDSDSKRRSWLALLSTFPDLIEKDGGVCSKVSVTPVWPRVALRAFAAAARTPCSAVAAVSSIMRAVWLCLYKFDSATRLATLPRLLQVGMEEGFVCTCLVKILIQILVVVFILVLDSVLGYIRITAHDLLSHVVTHRRGCNQPCADAVTHFLTSMYVQNFGCLPVSDITQSGFCVLLAQ